MIITIVGGGSTFTPGIVTSIALRQKELGVTDAKIFANDKGAIDPVIKSRVQTAVYRSAKTNDYKWM